MQGKVTKAGVDALIADAKVAGAAVFLWDAELKGFGAKAAPGGVCSYLIQYRMGGRGTPTKRLVLGRHGPLTAQKARDLAKARLGEVAKGIDVAEHKREKREKLAGLTFADGVEKFLGIHAKPTRYWHQKRVRLTSNDVKVLSGKPLSTISRKHVADAIDRAKTRSEAVARVLFADLRPFFKWAHERELVDANPMSGLRAPRPCEARERVLEAAEIAAMWRAAGEMSWPFSPIYRLLLLTGCRREEVAGARWSEMDLEAGIWTIPGARTKNGREHRLPLARQAIAILDRQAVKATKARLHHEDSDLVFSTTGTTPPSGFSKAKRALDLRMAEILGSKWDEKAKTFVGGKFKPWRIHDLRRTCATGMENLGVDTRVVETALNHVSGTKAGIVGVYQRAEHREAVRAAFQAWDAQVAKLAGQNIPLNVIEFRGA